MMKQKKAVDEAEITVSKPRAVNICSFGVGLLDDADGVPGQAFIMTSARKIIVAGPVSRSLRRTADSQATGTC